MSLVVYYGLALDWGRVSKVLRVTAKFLEMLQFLTVATLSGVVSVDALTSKPPEPGGAVISATSSASGRHDMHHPGSSFVSQSSFTSVMTSTREGSRAMWSRDQSFNNGKQSTEHHAIGAENETTASRRAGAISTTERDGVRISHEFAGNTSPLPLIDEMKELLQEDMIGSRSKFVGLEFKPNDLKTYLALKRKELRDVADSDHLLALKSAEHKPGAGQPRLTEGSAGHEESGLRPTLGAGRPTHPSQLLPHIAEGTE